MAVVSVRKKWSGRTVELSDDRRRYSEGYTVVLDSAENAPVLAVTASELPADGTPLPLDNWARLGPKRGREIGPLVYEVECIYETAPKAGRKPGVDPLSQPAKVSFTTQRVTELVEIDLDGRICANTAGVMFEPLTEDYDDIVMVVERNYPNIDVALLMSYRNAVNSDEFFSAPGQARMDSIEAVRVNEHDILYWTVTFRIVFREGVPATTQPLLAGGTETVGGPSRAWWRRVANVGFDEWIAGGGPAPRVYRRIVDPQNNPVSGPVPLDAAGIKLPEGQPTLVREFRFRNVKPFGVLNIL